MPWLPTLGATAKDWLQAGSWMAAAIGVIVTVINFWSELRLAREQRDRELRWRQAQAGKELNDDMLDDPLTWPALQMLDYSGREFELPSKKRTLITHGDVRHSLNPQTTITEERHIHIRDCFDSLFYYRAMFDHYTTSASIHKKDVAYPLEYYVPLLAQFRPEIDNDLHRFRLDRARKFLGRYPYMAGHTKDVLRA